MRASGYYGNKTHGYEASTYLLTESTYDAWAQLPLHSHANAHFCLVLSGSYTERLDGRVVRRQPGDLIFYGPGVGHAEHHYAPGRHFLIELGPELASDVDSAAPTWTSRRGATRALATRLFAEFRGERAPRAVMTELTLRLVELAARRPDEPRQRWLVEVERRLRATPEGSPDLDRLAREVGVHPVYLGRAFRKAYGCTPGEYQRRLRVERAQRALAGKAGIAHVAFDAGFCDQSHLNRVFKRHTGVTPGRYRRLVAPPSEAPAQGIE